MEVLGAKIEGAAVLDLFSGTGALGLEALSRGARRVVFVEKHRPLCARLERCLKEWGEKAETGSVWCGSAESALKRLAAQKELFDLVLADPPYEQGWGRSLVENPALSELLASGGIAVIETYKTEGFPERAGDLIRVKSSVYGDTAVTYYRKGT